MGTKINPSQIDWDEVPAGTIASSSYLGLNSSDQLVKAAVSGGGGISFDGNTPDGLLTYKDSDEATVETKLLFNGTTFSIKDASATILFHADTGQMKVGIGTDSPSHKLDVSGDIRIRGNDIRDNSGNPAITMDGSANVTIPNNLEVTGTILSSSDGNITITPNGAGSVILDGQNWPQADGSADQYLKTNGSGQLSWSTISGGSGGSSESTDTYSLGYSTLNGSSSGNVSDALTLPSGKTLTAITVDITTGFVDSYGSGTYASIYFKIGNTLLQPRGTFTNYGSISEGTAFWGSANAHGSVSGRITVSSETDIALYWANQNSTLTAGAATVTLYYR